MWCIFGAEIGGETLDFLLDCKYLNMKNVHHE
jgi:hypothetical protein